MLNVCCVNWQNYQGRGAEYVNKLRAMVARNLDHGTEGRFVCFTDDETGLGPGIHVRPLLEGLTGWWHKLWLFSPWGFNPEDRVLYFDLDTVLIGDLDDIARYDGQFAILRDFNRPNGLQSSVMAWSGGFGAEIWESWNRAGRPEIDGGDQAWIERVVSQPDILQDLFPGNFRSYKNECIPFPPENTSVVVFHGEPRPHECARPWVESMWTDSDTGHFQLGMVANVPLAQIRNQIQHSATLGLPRLTSQPANQVKVAIVGGGPSLGDPVTLASLARLRSEECQIWALNGSYDWLRDRDIVPDAHVLIDARLDNVRFVQNSREETTYYLASQCHWVVFDKLKRMGRKLVRLDLDVMGDCGTTVGTHAILTAFVEGYRDIHLFGFDSSYRGDEGHAYGQDLNNSERIVDAHIGDRVFKAAPWMVRQAEDFEGIARDVVAAGGSIAVYGDGLLPYKAHLLNNPPPRAAVIRAQEVLRRLPEGHVRGAEIGVFKGEMSAALLRREDLTLSMIDSWEGLGVAYLSNSGDYHATLSDGEQVSFRRAAKNAIQFARSRAVMLSLRSLEAVKQFSDRSLDFVFIDADHSYQGCRSDIEAWTPKVKPGGLLSGHDYDNPDFPEFGVKQAVDEFAARHGHSVELGENLTWFIRL